MDKYADLEIGLHRREVEVYSVDFRFVQPGSEGDVRLKQGTARIDMKALQKLASGSLEYSQALTTSLFTDPPVQASFLQAESIAGSLGLTLRVRLLIGPTAPELHSLQWETLLHPQRNTPICTDENIVFSRYLTSLDWRPVLLRPQGKLSALVVAANPANLSEYNNLAPIDVAGEVSRAREALDDATLTCLPDTQPGEAPGTGQATLNNIISSLRDGGQDVLYLVCHGKLAENEPYLFLEDEHGQADVILGTSLVTRLRELSQRPQMVILASCQSAGDPSAGNALSALGPRLAEAGIPAVIAMQSNIKLQTISQFMPTFFKELKRDGQIDRALSAARGAVSSLPDYWMPVLFMRLRSGRIWYVPGFGDDRGNSEYWPGIIRSITNKVCTPILGPGLSEPLMGSEREIARRWAEAYHYPMAPSERESMPQVSQYLAVTQYKRAPYDELEEYLRKDLVQRFDKLIPEDKRQAPLDELIETVGKLRRSKVEVDPYKTLAQLPLPVFITTNWNNLLANALKDASKDPQVVLCPWNDYSERAESIYTSDPTYQPSIERPLVYHLFGRLSDPDSIVLTEDDYFDFLIGVTRNKALIPTSVRRSLTDTALLFLGFQVDDWQFRVLFRSILAQQGGKRLERYPQVAVQLEPEEGRILEPEGARSYLEKYLFKGANVSLFWGSSTDFIGELQKRWQSRQA